jgi:hypothetical protein
VPTGLGNWWWDRTDPSVGGTTYAHGITVHAPSTVTIALNRACVAYDAKAGVDDLIRAAGPLSSVVFSVYGDDAPLWSSAPLRAGDAAVPVHVGLKGVKTMKLVVTPQSGNFAFANLADWADSVITCE